MDGCLRSNHFLCYSHLDTDTINENETFQSHSSSEYSGLLITHLLYVWMFLCVLCCSAMLLCVSLTVHLYYLCYQVMEGNKNAYGSVINDIHPPIITRYIRVIPVTKLSTTVCMRVELYGCSWDGRTHKHSHAVNVCVFSLSVLILDVDLVDFDFNRFPVIFTPPQTRVNSPETSHPEKSTQNLKRTVKLFSNCCAIKLITGANGTL